MNEQQKSIEIKDVSDLDLAELLAAQLAQAYQAQQNVVALQSELQRRKALLVESKCNFLAAVNMRACQLL